MGIDKRSTRGLSLVELMIAMAIGAVLSIGVIGMFTANSETYQTLQGQTRLQESAIFALETVVRDVERAGYRGCASRNTTPFHTMATASGIPYESDLRIGLQVHDSVGDGTWIPSTAAMDNSLTDNSFFHTDFLTLRFIDDDEAYLTSAMASAVANPVVSIVDQGVEDMGAGDLVAIHDCEKSTVFKVTGTAAVGGGTEIQHAVGADASDNATLALAQTGNFELGAAISGIITRTYFVAPGAGENNLGDTPLSLWRKQNSSSSIELVEGVENLQILLGVDANDDGVPEQYLSAGAGVDMEQVVTMEIQLTVNSVDSVGGTLAPSWGCLEDGIDERTAQTCFSGSAVDGLLRRSFTRTVQLRNQ